MMTTIASRALFALDAVALPASAQTVYKLVDRNGKVTYSEEAPKHFDGQVIRIDIDPNANRATLGLPPAAAKEGGEPGKRPPAPAKPDAPTAAERLEQARQKLEERRAELADAREHPRDDEVQWMGNKGGGTRAVPTEAYQQRIANLERQVKEAENEVRELENKR